MRAALLLIPLLAATPPAAHAAEPAGAAPAAAPATRPSTVADQLEALRPLALDIAGEVVELEARRYIDADTIRHAMLFVENADKLVARTRSMIGWGGVTGDMAAVSVMAMNARDQASAKALMEGFVERQLTTIAVMRATGYKVKTATMRDPAGEAADASVMFLLYGRDDLGDPISVVAIYARHGPQVLEVVVRNVEVDATALPEGVRAALGRLDRIKNDDGPATRPS